MFKSHKGEFGYLKKQPVKTGLFALLLILISAAVFLIGYKIKGDSKNILTVVAVLGVPPCAKFIVSFIMFIKAEKHTCSLANKEAFEKYVANTPIPFAYDCYMTSYKVDYPFIICFAYDSSLIALTDDAKIDIKECKEHIETYLKNNSIEDVKIYIFTSLDKFILRCESIDFSKYESNDKDIKSLELIKSISL
ncbi:MAG: hypothetical protein J6U09_06380 [Lachnospiraceae bacterium]|nr:hypothetical protein [Lachnospiraceae bacterium]